MANDASIPIGMRVMSALLLDYLHAGGIPAATAGR
jgi:hypothetical protein